MTKSSSGLSSPTQTSPASSRLRVVLFAPHFAEYASRLAAALSEGAEVLLVTEAKNFRRECDGLSLDLQKVAQAHYDADRVLNPVSLRGLLERRAIHRAIKSFRPDVIHIQEQGDVFTASVARTIAAARPIMLTIHDPAPHSGQDAHVARGYAPGLAELRRLASVYHVHGAHCERVLRASRGSEKPIVATAHGVILTVEDEPKAGDGSYLFFGRMEAYKGLDLLLDAVERLPRDHGLRVVLAGRGPDLDRHRTRIAAMPALEVFDRYLAPRDAAAAFRRAGVVLTPYHDATQSGVVSAAVGNGRPVITTAVGGLTDSVQHGRNGWVVPPGDPQALADAMLALRDEAVYRPLAEGARSAAKGEFAWPRIASRLLEVYAAMRDARRRRRD